MHHPLRTLCLLVLTHLAIAAGICAPAPYLAPRHALRTDTLSPDPLPQGAPNEESTSDSLQRGVRVLSTDATLVRDSIAARCARILQGDFFERTQCGVSIYDITAGEYIFQRGERQQLRPASNQKVITAIAALDALGGDYQYRTTLYADGAQCDSVLRGNLYLRGGFDPLLDGGDVLRLVAAVQARGVRRITGQVYFDRSFKDTLRLGQGWCWDDEEVPLTPLLLRGKRGLESRFIEALTSAGITLSADDASAPTNASRAICYKETPSSATPWGTVARGIDAVLLPMMKESDNLCAESLFYNLAAYANTPRGEARSGKSWASRRDASRAVLRLVRALPLDPSPFLIADGSGLSLYNYASPQLLVALLRYAAAHPAVYAHLQPALPVMGVDGTLAKRCRGTEAAGNVCAKTGSVEGVSTLSGYCTSPVGHLLCFSIMNQGQRRNADARRVQDSLCHAMTTPVYVVAPAN